MSRRPALLLVLGALAGCGGAQAQGPATTGPVRQGAHPALAARPAAPGEVVARGQSSPMTHGPYVFHGRYLVRFEQYAPENASLDFAGQTPFTAALTRSEGDPSGALKLFQQARRSDQRNLRIDGRYYLEVSFGDYPYVVRFTPLGSGA